MQRQKLKIAIFHFGLFYSGGGERLVLEEAFGLQKLGHDVTVFAPFIDEKKCFPELIKKVKVKKILPGILPRWFLDHILISILAACLFTPFIFYKFRSFDLYFGANQPGPWIAFLLSKINKKPYIIYLAQPTRLVHPRLIDQKIGLKLTDGFSFLGFFHLFGKPIIRYLDGISIRNAKKVFANGSYMTGVLKEVYSINPVNCPAGAFTNSKTGSLPNRFTGKIIFGKTNIKKPYVLLTNRHFAQKKFEYAIDAISLLKNKISLIITGAPTEYTKLLRRKYKNKKIYFTGLLSEKELSIAYDNAAIYVYPAPEEDFGMGIVEAMGRGVPVVAWGNAGPTGIIKDAQDGLLAKPFLVEDFSNQIRKLLTNKSLYVKISTNSIKKITNSFSYDAHVKILDNYIQKNLGFFQSNPSRNFIKINRHNTASLQKIKLEKA